MSMDEEDIDFESNIRKTPVNVHILITLSD